MDELNPKLSFDTAWNPTSKEEIVAALDADVKSAEWLLAPLHRQWFESIFWLVGEQYLEYASHLRRFQVRPASEHVPRSITNYILPHVETGVSILMEALPSPKVIPETREDSDRIAAEIAQGAIRYRDEMISMSQKKRDACTFTVTCGQSYFQSVLDKGNREVVRIPLYNREPEPVIDEVTGQPIVGPDGTPAVTIKETPQIDPKTGAPAYDEVIMVDENVNALSPFEIVPDWSASHPWEMRRYTHFRPQSREWIGRWFGSAAKKKVKAEPSYDVLIWHQLKVMEILMRSSQTSRLGLPTASGTSISDWRLMDDMAVVKARYMLPNDEMPDGRLLITAGKEVLEDGPYPYGEKLNLFTLRWSVVPGGLFSMGMVRNMILPQKRLNGIDTQVDLIRKLMGNPQWLSAKGLGFDGSRMTSKPGNTFYYNHRGGKPEPKRLPPAEAPQDAYQQRDRIIQDLDIISGMMDVLRGDRPVGVEAGVAIEALTEQAGKRFNPHLEDLRSEMKRLYLSRLDIMQKSTAWQTPRPVPLVGEDGKRDIKYFQAADFAGSLTIEIEAVPMIALSRVLKKQNFIEAIELGLIDIQTSLRNRERARGLLNVSEFDEQFSLDYKRAQMENEKILAGEPVKVGQYDNHEVHLAVLMEIIKSREFDNKPDRIRRIALEHAALHTVQLEAQAMLQADLAATQPQPGKNGGQPQPKNGQPQRPANMPGVVDRATPPPTAAGPGVPQ